MKVAKKTHKVSFHTNGNMMYGICDDCGASAKVKMTGKMTERKGMQYHTYMARLMLQKHFSKSHCQEQPTTFQLVS